MVTLLPFSAINGTPTTIRQAAPERKTVHKQTDVNQRKQRSLAGKAQVKFVYCMFCHQLAMNDTLLQ